MRNRLKGQMIGNVPQLWEDFETSYDRATAAYWQGGMSAEQAGFGHLVAKQGTHIPAAHPSTGFDYDFQGGARKPKYDQYGRPIINGQHGPDMPHPEYEQRHDLRNRNKLRMS